MDIMWTFFSAQSILVAVTLTLVVHYILHWFSGKSPTNLPPGPREWGTNWKLLKASWYGTIPELATEWAKKYGPMTFVYSMGQPILFLNTPSVSRKLLASDEYKFLVADRGPNAAFKIIDLYNKDLLFTKFDTVMKKKRRLFFKVIGVYGDGVERFENVVWSELKRMFVDIEQVEGKDTDMAAILTRSIKNILYILALGERPSDPFAPDVLEEYDDALNDMCKAEVDYLLAYLPFVAKLPCRIRTAVERLKRAKKEAEEMMFYGPKRTHIPGQPRGITDLLLEYRNKPGYEFMATDETHLIGFLTTLFMAAHLTTKSTLTGIFLCLVNYPDVTKRIQQEVDTVLNGQQPRMEHKSQMPYTEAAILDTLRLISSAPISTFRRASEDLDFEGFSIPKDTMIFVNNWYFQHDENLWQEPWGFRPGHFLDSEGNLLPVEHQTRKNILPFGIGVRACPGDIFARSRVFLFVTSILQRYDLLPPANEKLTPANFKFSNEHLQGVIRQTLPYKCRLVRRKVFYN